MHGTCTQKFDPFLAPAGEEEEESSIQVFCNVVCTHKLGTFLFSALTGGWRFITSFSLVDHIWMRYPELVTRCYAYKCFFWVSRVSCVEVMLVLDMGEMEFSVVGLGLSLRSKTQDRLTVKRGGRLGLFIIQHRMLYLYSNSWEGNALGLKIGNSAIQFHCPTIIFVSFQEPLQRDTYS
ncbi:hypothetical protein PR202_gb24253 [Eleusine coracana subsp. coracana]|uniref:Uncharacterized protein n=1 Tax=Eleusine coracana subsp. coracana TaxID=191504 RepID=A0AAV5FLJ8_ELECO|nr:hypothetical protein PR202_gb24253 [Eleusine coracana subsp. coracana]